MTALAKWRWGPQTEICNGCEAAAGTELACRRYGLGPPCPQDEYAPHTREAQEVWALAPMFAGRVRRDGMGGLAGFDMSECAMVAAAHGVSADAVARWLPFMERGMMAAVADARENAG